MTGKRFEELFLAEDSPVGAGDEVVESRKREGKSEQYLADTVHYFFISTCTPLSLGPRGGGGVCALNHKRGPGPLPALSYIARCENGGHGETHGAVGKNCRQIQINTQIRRITSLILETIS